MIRFKFPAIAAVAVLAVSTGAAQITQLDNENAFSEDRVLLTFDSALQGAAAEDLFAAYGIRIQGIGGGAPVIGGDLVGGIPFGFLNNAAQPGDGITSELVFDFRYPVRQVGFLLRNGGPGVEARFTLRNVRGENIGVRLFSLDNNPAPFAGFEAPAGESFSRVLLSYGQSANAEQVFELVLTYAERPTFATYLAQVADAALPTGGLRSDILIANLSNTTATGSLALLDDAGDPLNLTLNGQAGSNFPLSIPPFGLRRFVSAGIAQPPLQGSARIETNVPVSATAVFQILNATGNPVSEAGVGAADAVHRSVAAVVRRVQGTIDSGIAVTNAGDQMATASAQLFDGAGALQDTNTDFLRLAPGQHRAAFLPDIFPTVAPDFSGTMVISSNQPLAVTVLRTALGLVISSLPVGTLEQ